VVLQELDYSGGFYETGLAGAIFEVDASGWDPSDLTTLPYKNIPRDIYSVYKKN
jgi:hypothetical protein